MIAALMGKIRPFCALLVAAWVCAACGGESDAQKKRIRELEEELTRLQNSHDRIDERVTSLEVTRSAPDESASPQAESEQAAPQPQVANLERPPLKVFKLGPSTNGGGTPAAVEQEPPVDEDSGEPRPVIRGSGQNVQKASGSAPAPGSKARGSKLSQNGSVTAPAKANR
jgi:hypothetical protein